MRKKKGTIYIGTSGWSYKDWVGIFYPKRLKSTGWLAFYSAVFRITEINMSFYRLPSRETAAGWARQVPDGFLFCPKMSRYLTHIKRLRAPEEPLERFFDRFEPLQHALGPILIQLPATLKFDPAVVEPFYILLASRYKAWRFALEGRHASWLEDASLDMMRRYNISFVISESGHGFPYGEHITAHDIYVRFHGPGKLYASLYDDAGMKKYAKQFSQWQRDGHNVWVFFNNDFYGYGIKNAIQLEKHLTSRRTEAQKRTHRQVLALL